MRNVRPLQAYWIFQMYARVSFLKGKSHGHFKGKSHGHFKGKSHGQDDQGDLGKICCKNRQPRR